MNTRKHTHGACALFIALGLLACSEDAMVPIESGTDPIVNATGGGAVSGGTVLSGGTVTSGGALMTGGLASTGGMDASGGAEVTGGMDASGGDAMTGGMAASGGAEMTGGMAASGGAEMTGGMAASGGETMTGGMAASGGDAMTGGTTGAGVCGGDTPHGCYTPQATNTAECPPQIPEQTEGFVVPLNEWVPCGVPGNVCNYDKPMGGVANCFCDTGVHWICTYGF